MQEMVLEEAPSDDYIDIKIDQLVFWVPAKSFLEAKEEEIKETFSGDIILLNDNGRMKVAFEKWEYGEESYERIKVLAKEGNVNELYNFFDEVYPEQQSIEKEDLHKWRKEIKDLNTELENWNEFSERERQRISQRLAKLVSEFPQLEAKNEQKIEARDSLRKAATFRDKRGQENPPVARTKLVKGLNRLEKRLDGLETIRDVWEKKREGVREIILKFGKARKIKTMAAAMSKGYDEKKLHLNVFEKLRSKIEAEFEPISEFLIEPYLPYIVAINALLKRGLKEQKQKDAYVYFKAIEGLAGSISKELTSALYGGEEGKTPWR